MINAEIGKETLILLRRELKKRPIKKYVLKDINLEDPESKLLGISFVINKRDESGLMLDGFIEKYIQPAVSSLLEKIKVPRGKTTMISSPLVRPFGENNAATVTLSNLSCRVTSREDIAREELFYTIDMLYSFTAEVN